MAATVTPDARRGIVPGDDDLPGPVPLDDDDRARLLDLARVALAVAAGAAPETALEAARDGTPQEEPAAAAFVTLSVAGELRGCMGSLEPSLPVGESVVAAAVSAALRDPRFPPVAPGELATIEIEVSVLGPLLPLAEPERFRLGIDGIVVERGGRRGLLLPEVATGHGLDRPAMLETASLKAGLGLHGWRERGAVVSAFRTERFGGPAVPANIGATPAPL